MTLQPDLLHLRRLLRVPTSFLYTEMKKTPPTLHPIFPEKVSISSPRPQSTMVQYPKPTLSQPTPSFRLRNPSLNSLRLRRIFDVFDRNGDGIITVHELSLALQQLGLDADDELESTVRCYIQPGKQGLEYDDFVALHQSLGDSLFGEEEESGSGVPEEAERDLKEAFKVFDEDGDGFISAAELQSVLRKLGMKEGREIESVKKMICSVDYNRDGRVDFYEFKQMMRNVSVPSA